MLLAIDVGNTHTVFGAWNGEAWIGMWRRATNIQATDDELAVWLHGVCTLQGLEFAFEDAWCCSVVPTANTALAKMTERYLGKTMTFLEFGDQVGIPVTYDPPHAVGADRIANALAALQIYNPPIIVVDFGTATTFDAISRDGAYLGGAILPGVKLSSEALFARAAKLPQVEYLAPETALGTNTVHALQSGIMLGYAGSVDALCNRIDEEMGGNATIVATGGLGGLFLGISSRIESYNPTLTLDGLVLAQRMHLARGTE